MADSDVDSEVDSDVDMTPAEIARVFGVGVQYVNAATDPEAERLAERRRLAAIYGVGVQYFRDVPIFQTEGVDDD
jgi:hypothetical protein